MFVDVQLLVIKGFLSERSNGLLYYITVTVTAHLAPWTGLVNKLQRIPAVCLDVYYPLRLYRVCLVYARHRTCYSVLLLIK